MRVRGESTGAARDVCARDVTVVVAAKEWNTTLPRCLGALFDGNITAPAKRVIVVTAPPGTEMLRVNENSSYASAPIRVATEEGINAVNGSEDLPHRWSRRPENALLSLDDALERYSHVEVLRVAPFENAYVARNTAAAAVRTKCVEEEEYSV